MVAVVLVATVPAGCGSRPSETVAAALRAAIERTSLSARRFNHEIRAAVAQPDASGTGGATPAASVPGGKTVVEGFLEDDGRYKVRFVQDDVPAYEEVASDDALAVRVLDPARLAWFLRAPDVQDDVTAVLQRQQWVLDPVGAPDPSSYEAGLSPPDTVLEAVTALSALLRAVAGQSFTEFNPDSLAYDEKEDPFPKPPKGGRLKRYDALDVRLPTFSEIEGTRGNRNLPGPEHFRKLAVYIRDGLVVEIRESVRIEHRARQLPSLLTALGIEGDIPEDDRPRVVRADVNRRRAAEGRPPLYDFTRVTRLADFGGAVKVVLPEAAVTADLSVLRNRGKSARSNTSAGPAVGPAGRDDQP